MTKVRTGNLTPRAFYQHNLMQAVPTRTQTRLEKYDDLVLNNDDAVELSASDDTQPAKRRRNGKGGSDGGFKSEDDDDDKNADNEPHSVEEVSRDAIDINRRERIRPTVKQQVCRGDSCGEIWSMTRCLLCTAILSHGPTL